MFLYISISREIQVCSVCIYINCCLPLFLSLSRQSRLALHVPETAIMSLRTSSVKNHSSDDEKAQPNYGAGVVEPYEDPLEENEVFKKTKEGVDFRTVGWPRASVIFLKGMQSSTSRSYTYLQVSSHLCDRGAQHPFSNVQLGSLGRRTQCRRLGSFEYVHSRCARRFPKFPSRMTCRLMKRLHSF